MTDLSEPSLWAIVTVLAGIVAWGGKRVISKLDECEKDRELLSRKIQIVAVRCSVATGVEINIDDVK